MLKNRRIYLDHTNNMEDYTFPNPGVQLPDPDDEDNERAMDVDTESEDEDGTWRFNMWDGDEFLQNVFY
jgi:hypothetical protein